MPLTNKKFSYSTPIQVVLTILISAIGTPLVELRLRSMFLDIGVCGSSHGVSLIYVCIYDPF